MKPTQQQIDAFVEARRHAGDTDPEIASFLASQGVVPPSALIQARDTSQRPGTEERPVTSSADAVSDKVTGAYNWTQRLLERTGIPQALSLVAGTATELAGKGTGTAVAGVMTRPEDAMKGKGPTASADSTPMAATARQKAVAQATVKDTQQAGRTMGEQGGRSAPLAILTGNYGGAALNAGLAVNQGYDAWRTIRDQVAKTDPNLPAAERLGQAVIQDPEKTTQAALSGALGIFSAGQAAAAAARGEILPQPGKMVQDLSRIPIVKNIVKATQGIFQKAVLGKQAAAALNEPTYDKTQIENPAEAAVRESEKLMSQVGERNADFPDLKNEENGQASAGPGAARKGERLPQEGDYEQYRLQAMDAKGNLREDTPYRKVAQNVDDAYQVLEDVRSAYGEAKSEYLMQNGAKDIPSAQEAVNNWLGELANRTGWSFDEDGNLVDVSLEGDKPMSLTAGDQKLLKTAWTEISSMEPTAASVDRTVDNLQKSVKYDSRSLESPIDTNVSGAVKGLAAALNSELYKNLDSVYQEMNTVYGMAADLSDEINAGLGPNIKKGESFVQRLGSRTPGEAVRIAEGLRSFTGYDMIRDFLMAKIAMENVGDPRSRSLLEEVASPSGNKFNVTAMGLLTGVFKALTGPAIRTVKDLAAKSIKTPRASQAAKTPPAGK